MQRRTFIGGATAVLATAATSACNGSDSGGGSASGTAESTGAESTGIRTATSANRAAANWTGLSHQLDGALVRPGDRSWPPPTSCTTRASTT